MRRVVKAIATKGDVCEVLTLTNPEGVQALVDVRAKKLWNQKT